MIKVQSPYIPMYTDKEHFIILLTGGRGTGKSFNVSTFLERLSFQRGHKILFSRYTMTSASVSVIPEFQQKIELDGMVNKFIVTQTDIKNKFSGSEILFRGIKTSSGNQTANLKSIQGITTFCGDEMEEWQSEEEFDTLRLSIRQKGIQNRVILVMNPSNAEHFVYKKYIQDTHKIVKIDGVDVQISTHPDVLHIHTSYLDNKDNLAPQFLQEVEELKRKAIKDAEEAGMAAAYVNGVFSQDKYNAAYQTSFNKSKYAYKIIGRWADIADGVIFTDWEEGEFDTSLPYCYGQDYGFSIDPTTLVKVAVDKKRKRVYVNEEYYSNTPLGTSAVYEVNASRIARREDLIVGDSAEDRLISDLAELGLNIIECEKGPGSVSAGISALQDYTLVVTPESSNVKRELKNYQWNDKKAGIPLQNGNDHCFVGSTEILTIDGVKKIVDVKEGDFVATPSGFKEVLIKWNNGKRQVKKYLMQFDMLCVYLHCTENHLIKTDKGWQQIKDLRSGQKIYLHKSLTEKFTGFIPENGISQNQTRGCIGLYGSSLTEQSHQDTTCITSTGIRGITRFQTLRLKKAKCIYEGMASKKFKTKNGLKNSVKKVLKQLRNGTQARKVLNNTVSKQSKQDSEHGIYQKRSASSAVANLNPRYRIMSSAQMPANQNTEGYQEQTTKNESARIVEMNLKSISIKNQHSAQNRVQDFQEVYDLMVADDHCYFANGVLVHNCIDPIRYAFRQLAGEQPDYQSDLTSLGIFY